MREDRAMRLPEWLGIGRREWKKPDGMEVQPSKTLWDLLQLLIVPVILIVVTVWWSSQQTSKSERERADRQALADRAAAEQVRQEATLRSYLDKMRTLMIDHRLVGYKEG